MHRFVTCLLALSWAALLSFDAQGATFRLEDGDVFEGRPVIPPENEGLVIQLDVGGFSKRIPWNRFDQTTLKEMVQDQRLRDFVDPFIDLTPEQFERALPRRGQPVTVREVPRLERPKNPGFFSAITTTGGLLFVGVFYLANLLAAYEVAVFRRRPVLLVCGVSAILPVAGQLVFLSLPTSVGPAVEASPDARGGPVEESPVAAAAAPAAGLGLASAQEASSAKGGLDGVHYKRGEVSFDRRFFETKFAGFFRTNLAEPEKSYSIIVRAGSKELVAARISRISFNEVQFQLVKGGEGGFDFSEISEVLLRKK